MVRGIRVKVCGLTTLADAELADAGGADYLGFICYPKSPRHISLEQFRAMAPRLPARKKVAVLVEPDEVGLQELAGAGFDLFQIHFSRFLEHDLAAWERAVGRSRLWLAPKLPPGVPFPLGAFQYADTFLIDAFRSDAYGGTGKTADWPEFAERRTAHPEKTWILAGGLKPENIREALQATGAKVVDVNSGVERMPGIKDPDRLRAFFERVGSGAR